MLAVVKICICVLVIVFSAIGLEAGQVTMATYDFDGDYVDEIVRTDENQQGTVIKIYKRMDNSFFYKPLTVFQVPGRLVQVPEIADINGDGSKDYVFTTGIDVGVIYYNVVSKTFVRTNAYDFDAAAVEADTISAEKSYKREQEATQALVHNDAGSTL